MKANHTKGKVYLQEYTDAYTNIVRCDNGKGFETLYIASAPERENAKHIVKCWSMHDEMLEFIQEMARRYPNSPWIYKEANEIIKKATE